MFCLSAMRAISHMICASRENLFIAEETNADTIRRHFLYMYVIERRTAIV